MQSHDAEYAGSFGGWISKPKTISTHTATMATEPATLDAVRESRRKIHEALVGSPAWVADSVREELGRLEAAIEAHVREQVAQEIEAQPSTEHQAIYLDEYDQVWCDYPTSPPDDQVLPLVWASERAQSRSELADGGNKLRVIGWCR